MTASLGVLMTVVSVDLKMLSVRVMSLRTNC